MHHTLCHATFTSSILEVLVAIVTDSSATTSTVPLHLAGDVRGDPVTAVATAMFAAGAFPGSTSSSATGAASPAASAGDTCSMWLRHQEDRLDRPRNDDRS